ncbi:MAG: DUF4112 domain-containing protein [Tepidisphaeraceae bacterium]
MKNPLAGLLDVSDAENELDADLRRAETFARLLDTQFQMGGIRFGVDALVGLIPVVGDTVATALGFYPILIARKHGLGKGVIARMLFNLGVNFAAGLTPLVGDAADVFIRVNIRNVALLRQTAVKKGLVSA